jgi:hypothetical protein
LHFLDQFYVLTHGVSAFGTVSLFSLTMPLDIMEHIRDCMLDGDVVFKDLSQEHGGYRFGFGAKMMCWIKKQVNFD